MGGINPNGIRSTCIDMWILLVVMYTGQVQQTEFTSYEYCETALLDAVDAGRYKHIKTIECVLND